MLLLLLLLLILTIITIIIIHTRDTTRPYGSCLRGCFQRVHNNKAQAHNATAQQKLSNQYDQT